MLVTGYVKRSKQFSSRVYKAYGEGEGHRLVFEMRIIHQDTVSLGMPTYFSVRKLQDLICTVNLGHKWIFRTPAALIFGFNCHCAKLLYWSDTALDLEPAFSRAITSSKQFSFPELPYWATFWVFHVPCKYWLSALSFCIRYTNLHPLQLPLLFKMQLQQA